MASKLTPQASTGHLHALLFATLLGASLILQGCIAVPIIAGVAGSASIEHVINGTATKTFNHSLPRTRASVLVTLKRMDMKITKDEKTETGWVIVALAEDLEIDIDLDTLTGIATHMQVVASTGTLFFKDSATASAIIDKTLSNFKFTPVVLDTPKKVAKLPTKSRKTVQSIQAKLAKLGYKPGPADGILGRKTKNAIKKYQRDSKVAVDGVASAWLNAQLSIP